MSTIGEKRQRIRIEQAVQVSDGQGGRTTSYALRVVVNAHERPLSGAEAQRLGQLTATLASVWEIWWRSDIRVTDRIRVGTRVLEIASYQDPADDHEQLYLYCSEVQDQTRTDVPAYVPWIQSGFTQ